MRGVFAACFAVLAIGAAASEVAVQPVLVQGDEDRSALRAFLPAEQLEALSPEQRAQLARAARDESWPRRAAAYLQSQHGVSQDDWKLLSQKRQGLLLLDWAKQRTDALQARRIVLLQSSPPTEEQARQMRLLAAGGFLEPAELEPLQGLRTDAGFALLEAAAIQPDGLPAGARADAARQFRQDAPGARTPPIRLRTAGPAQNVAPTANADLEVAYRTAQQMVLDPESFEKTRSDLFPAASTASERLRRGRLRQQLGHLFAAANRLRAQDRLEFRLGNDESLKGAFGKTEVADVKDPATAALHWKIIIRLHEKYKDSDPALLSPTLVHELEHAHNDARRIERYGLNVARRIDGFQEEEERALIAESHLASAYASALRPARDRNPTQGVNDLHLQSEMLGALEDMRSLDNLRYRAKLKDVAFILLRRNDSIKHRDALLDLAGLKKETEQDLFELKAERVLLTRGRRGVQDELAKPGDARYKSHLLNLQRRQPSQTLEGLEAKATELRSLLRLIAEERRRGLDLL